MALSPIVEIKNPCHKNWDKMTPLDKGRFCSSCATVVTDFTNKTPEEIKYYFQNNNTSKTCGVFKDDFVSVRFKTDKIVSYLNNRKLNFISLFILGVLTIVGCKTKKHSTRTMGNARFLDKEVNKIETVR